MSLLIQAQTSKDDKEILECLDLVLRSSRLGLVHESVDVEYIGSYTSKQSHRSRRGILVDANFSLQEAGLHVSDCLEKPKTNFASVQYH